MHGVIRFEWWCQCYNCGFEECGSGKWLEAVRMLKKLGWKFAKGQGWKCRSCANAVKAAFVQPTEVV